MTRLEFLVRMVLGVVATVVGLFFIVLGIDGQSASLIVPGIILLTGGFVFNIKATHDRLKDIEKELKSTDSNYGEVKSPMALIDSFATDMRMNHNISIFEIHFDEDGMKKFSKAFIPAENIKTNNSGNHNRINSIYTCAGKIDLKVRKWE